MNWITGTAESVAAQVAKLIAERLSTAVRERGRAALGLPGGRSVARVGEALLEEELPWQNVDMFFVDERCVDPDSPDSNYRTLRDDFFEALVDTGRIPRSNIHRPQDEADAHCSPRRYTQRLLGVSREGRAGAASPGEKPSPHFDLVLLGVGEDGHVASLFPDHPSMQAGGREFILVENAPKAPPQRISASRALLEDADTAILLFLGEGKREALRRFRAEHPPSVESFPCRLAEAIDDAWAATDLA